MRRKKTKESVPYFTASGLFKKRSNTGITKHSGIICIDFDNISDIDEARSILGADPYTHAMFVSISGHGLAVLVKINPKLHKESFDWLNGYYVARYDMHVDIACSDVSRPRFISWDPDLYVNHFSQTVHVEPRKKEKPKPFIFVDDDFHSVLKQIVDRRIDLTQSYVDWRDLGFAISEKFGEGGREYFHQISQFHPDYSSRKTDKQYDNCLRAKGQKQITISTFFWKAKQAGCSIYSEKTERIIRTANFAKKDRSRKMDQVVPGMIEVGHLDEEDSEVANKIVEQVYKENGITTENGSIVLDIKEYLGGNYKFRRNVITRQIECNGQLLDDIALNSIFIDVKTVIDKASKDLVTAIIFSEFTPSYNPFHEFFSVNRDINTGCEGIGDLATKFCYTINSDTPNHTYFMLKWMVSMIGAIHGKISPLLLVLTGGQNTGKTYWFRHLLPDSLQQYYAESTLDGNPNDDAILMTKKLIIMDDEFGGKTKREEKSLKKTLSKETFSIREPYGRISVDLRRLCMLAGTTNEEQIISDPTGNRRIVPVNVISIDHDLYNSIDKTALFMDLYRLYKSGYNFELTKEEIQELNAGTERFENIPLEEQMLNVIFRQPEPNDPESVIEKLQTGEILAVIQNYTKTPLNVNKLGAALKKQGFEYKNVRYGYTNNRKKWVYSVVRMNVSTVSTESQLF